MVLTSHINLDNTHTRIPASTRTIYCLPQAVSITACSSPTASVHHVLLSQIPAYTVAFSLLSLPDTETTRTNLRTSLVMISADPSLPRSLSEAHPDLKIILESSMIVS
jgi:hypothetical protein